MTEENKDFIKSCFNDIIESPFNELTEMLIDKYHNKITRAIIDKEKNNINGFINRNENNKSPERYSVKYLTTQYLYGRIIDFSNFDRFNKYYLHYLNTEEEISRRKNYEPSDLYDRIMAFNLAKFYNYLDRYSIDDDNNKTSKLNTKKITLAQQMLVFNCVCSESFNSLTNVDKAKILAFLFEANFQNIRGNYSNLNKIKTSKYLKSILPVFEEIGMDDIVKVIQDDIKKATKREIKKRPKED